MTSRELDRERLASIVGDEEAIMAYVGELCTRLADAEEELEALRRVERAARNVLDPIRFRDWRDLYALRGALDLVPVAGSTEPNTGDDLPAPDNPQGIDYDRWAHVARPSPHETFSDSLKLEVETSLQLCELHRAHQPAYLTVEWHHIIPVAWQLATPLQPGVTPPSPGRDTNGRGMLWDNRGAWLCPTGHRNVHHWIVEIMHEVALEGSNDPLAAITKVAGTHIKSDADEIRMAAQALVRLQPFGSLLRLTQLGEWGQI